MPVLVDSKQIGVVRLLVSSFLKIATWASLGLCNTCLQRIHLLFAMCLFPWTALKAWIEQCGPLLVSILGTSKFMAGDLRKHVFHVKRKHFDLQTQKQWPPTY